ncbi:MAG: fructose-bisphosphate aldolase [Anaerolineae bacterium]|nr:fructose-bisphosphate aldolase [Anaerolineae bacterium]
MIGKTRRMNRILSGEKKRCLLSPLDHGGWLGPVKGLDRPRHIVQEVIAGGANAILASPGFIRQTADLIPLSAGIVLRVSLTAGLSKQGTQETPIASLDTALQMDADAVAVSVFFGREGDIEIYRWLAGLIQTCHNYEVPVVAEMMPPEDRAYKADAIAHAARIGMEIGADIIKTNYCGNVEEFREVVASVPVPIIVAGGPKQGNDSEESLITMVRDVIAAGAAGVAIGRRVWQSSNPQRITRKIYETLWA